MTYCLILRNVLVDNYLATYDTFEINIWFKFEDDIEYYSNIKKIRCGSLEKISDILLINNNYFISSHYKSKIIKFYDINNSYKETIVSGIDCIDSSDSLLLFKGFIVINCIKGIALLSINTKELVQYLILNDNYYCKSKTVFRNDENIYIFGYFDNIYNKKLSLLKLEFRDGLFNTKEKYKQIIMKDNNNRDGWGAIFLYKIICINNEDIIAWGPDIWILKEEKIDELNEFKDEKVKEKKENMINNVSQNNIDYESDN